MAGHLLETFVVDSIKKDVIAGLDPAIHGSSRTMDARVKPAHDNLEEIER